MVLIFDGYEVDVLGFVDGDVCGWNDFCFVVCLFDVVDELFGEVWLVYW